MSTSLHLWILELLKKTTLDGLLRVYCHDVNDAVIPSLMRTSITFLNYLPKVILEKRFWWFSNRLNRSTCEDVHVAPQQLSVISICLTFIWSDAKKKNLCLNTSKSQQVNRLAAQTFGQCLPSVWRSFACPLTQNVDATFVYMGHTHPHK